MRVILALIAAALSAGVAAICLLAPGYYAYLLGTLATTALVGVGLNVLLGLAGEVSLGQAGFLALGAYGVGILTTKAGLGFWAALPLSVLLVVAISALLSIPALRVTGPYLAMVTIAFGFIVESVSGERLDQFTANHIFRRLGMTSTRFRPPPSWDVRLARTEAQVRLRWRR